MKEVVLKMRVAKIKTNSVGNWKGISTSLYVSGCCHRCKGCFQPETWNKQFGELYNEETEQFILNSLNYSYITNLVLLGGEPFMDYNLPTLIALAKRVKTEFPQKNIIVFSGWTYEELQQRQDARELLACCDVLVDGRFDETKKNIRLTFKGSENQRLIDLNQTRAQNALVLID